MKKTDDLQLQEAPEYEEAPQDQDIALYDEDYDEDETEYEEHPLRRFLLPAVIGLVVILIAVFGTLKIRDVVQNRRPEIYRNLDAHLYSLNTQVRTPGADGMYRVRFAYETEMVEYAVADEALLHYIDSMDTLGLVVEDGVILDAFPARELATEVCKNAYIKSVTPDTIVVSSNLTMNGTEQTIPWTQKAVLCDVSRSGSVSLLPTALQPMDGISVYANDKGVVTHIYVTSHPTESPVYWRTQRRYSTSTKETTRYADDNGVYSIDFYTDGKLETLQCKDKAIVTAIDAVAADSPHFGFTFDKEGYITGTVNSAMAIRSLLACENYDITDISDQTITAEDLLDRKGAAWTGTLAGNCKLYDVSATAESEGRLGQAVDSLQPGDQVTVWTNPQNEACLVYITNRLVETPAYFNMARKYDSQTKETTRKPNSAGLYTITLLKSGDTEAKEYLTTDKALITAIDKEASRCVSIVADEKGFLQNVYPAKCVFGQSVWVSSYLVTNLAGSVVSVVSYGNPDTVKNAVMLPDCKIYNTSTTGQLGAPTTLQVGDYIYAFRQPSGELVQIFVNRRLLGPETMYYNTERMYDAQLAESTRQKDENGMYVFTVLHEGQKVTLKTDNKTLADTLDSFTPGAVSLKVEGDVILEVNDPKYACGGNQISHNFVYQGLNEKGQHVAVNGEGKESVFTLAADCVIFDVRNGGAVAQAPVAGARLTGYTDRNGKVRILFLR